MWLCALADHGISLGLKCMLPGSGFERFGFKELRFAYIQSAGSQGAHSATVQDGLPGTAGFAAAARSLHARLHADPEEAELGPA
jgi:hypothetical protein